MDRITVEKQVLTENGMGGHEQTWQKRFSAFAEVVVKSGKESNENGQVTATTTTEFTLRNIKCFSYVNESDRILFNCEYYNIEAILRGSPRDLFFKIIATRGEIS